MFCPVIEIDFFESKNSTVFATEESEVGNFRDVRLKILCRLSDPNESLIAVSMNPATTQLERIPFSPHSRAVFFENASSAPFVEAYIAKPL
jgi:hypothetical protein